MTMPAQHGHLPSAYGAGPGVPMTAAMQAGAPQGGVLGQGTGAAGAPISSAAFMGLAQPQSMHSASSMGVGHAPYQQGGH